MKYIIFAAGLFLSVVIVTAQANTKKQPLFTWDLLWAGSWEESKTLHNRADFRFGFTRPGLLLRGQAVDRRPLNFQNEQLWGESVNKAGTASFGLYHKTTGSRLLYGALDEWGLPARIRSPWIRAAPYTDNHKPVMADLKTAASSTKAPEAYLYLSSPRFSFNNSGIFSETSIRGFASAQITAAAGIGESQLFPAFSGGLEGIFGNGIELLLEGFYTGAELPAKQSSAWFSDPPPLPARDFRLGAAAVMLNLPFLSVSSDWAWSETFAYGSGIYGNAGVRFNPPRDWAGDWMTAKPGPWSLSIAADGMGERYTGRDGTTPGGGFRTAGKIEWKGPHSSLFRVNTALRSSTMGDDFNRSASGIYYRFPALSGSTGNFPLRVSRVSFNADRNAVDWNKINDSLDGSLGLSLSLPPMLLPRALLPASTSKKAAEKPKSYPLSINFSSNVKWLASDDEIPTPYPFFSGDHTFDSSKTSCELIWSPGIFQFRSRLAFTTYEKKDDLWEWSFSTAVRFKHGRFSVKMASPDLFEKWNCTLSWRLEK